MEYVLTILREEIIKNLEMKLEYEKIRLQNIKDKIHNIQVILMISYYDNVIMNCEQAIKILSEAERNCV